MWCRMFFHWWSLMHNAAAVLSIWPLIAQRRYCPACHQITLRRWIAVLFKISPFIVRCPTDRPLDNNPKVLCFTDCPFFLPTRLISLRRSSRALSKYNISAIGSYTWHENNWPRHSVHISLVLHGSKSATFRPLFLILSLLWSKKLCSAVHKLLHWVKKCFYIVSKQSMIKYLKHSCGAPLMSL